MHTVAETPEFRAQAGRLLTDEETGRLISLLAHYPEAGDLIAGTGGFRKLRFARQGGGKRGGYRVVYFYCDERLPVLLAAVYAKSDRDNLTKADRNALAEVAASIKQAIRR